MRKEIMNGRITEKELVNIFGTDAQRVAYEKSGRIVGKYRVSLFKTINRYCKVMKCGTENGERIYEISNVLEYPLPQNFKKMNHSLYRYTVPFVLSVIVGNNKKDTKFDITGGRLAESINMVNRNYALCKQGRKSLSCYTNISRSVINEFFSKTDSMVDWYIRGTLNYLRDGGFIDWGYSRRVCVEPSGGYIDIDEDGTVTFDVVLDNHTASDDELEFYRKCVDIADVEADINKPRERYYSHKANKFQTALKRELYKKKIKYVYKTFCIHSVSYDKCVSLFGLYEDEVANISSLIGRFNNDFIEMLAENAKKRYDANSDKYTLSRDDYLLQFSKLCQLTIDTNAGSLSKVIEAENITADYGVTIKREINYES